MLNIFIDGPTRLLMPRPNICHLPLLTAYSQYRNNWGGERRSRIAIVVVVVVLVVVVIFFQTSPYFLPLPIITAREACFYWR